MTPVDDLAPALASPEALVAVARVEETLEVRAVGDEEQGQVALLLGPVLAAREDGRSPGARAVVPFSRSRLSLRGGGDAWDRSPPVVGGHLLVALALEGDGWQVSALQGLRDPAEPTVEVAREAARLARGPIARDPDLVQALAGEERLPREAIVCRLERPGVPPEVAIGLLAEALATAPAQRRERLRMVLERRFDPTAWASRANALVLTTLARGLLAAERSARLFWAGDLARCLRYPFDPEPDRQERVARALVLLVDAPPVEMVAALEGLAGEGSDEDQAAARDLLALWLQL